MKVDITCEANKMLGRIFEMSDALAKKGASNQDLTGFYTMILVTLIDTFYGVVGEFDAIEFAMKMKYDKILTMKFETIQ